MLKGWSFTINYINCCISKIIREKNLTKPKDFAKILST